MNGPDMERVARAYLMSAHRPGDEEVAALVAELGPVVAAQLTAAATGGIWMRAAAELAKAETSRLRLAIPEDEEWPACLSAPLPTDSRVTGAAPPLGVWVRGSAQLDRVLARAVTVAGASAATPYGQKAAFDLGRELADAGWTVITSGSFGVSGSVTRGALAARGPVLVLPPAPLTGTIPAGHRLLFGKVARDGLMVTESVPGLPADEGAAIRQTQLAAGLAAAVVLIEPRPRGLDRRLIHLTGAACRLVLAYPGPVDMAGSAFAHHLIRTGRARLVASPRQVLTDLEGGWSVDARDQG
jgi:DNA processing protein